MIQQLLVTFITYESELDHVIPSLLGYIIIVPNFNCATWSFFPEHNFDDGLSLRWLSSSYHFALNNKLDSEFVSYPGFQ